MGNNFVVTSATYMGSDDGNPVCIVRGTVNGESVHVYPFYAAIMQAYNAAGNSGVQQLLGPMMLRETQPDAPPFPVVPVFPKSDYPPASPSSAYAPFPTAMAGSWSA